MIGSDPHKQVVTVERADRIAIERMTRAVGDDRAAEAVLARQGDRRHQIKRRPVPDRLEELLAEFFNPGDYYESEKPGFFFRWQVEFKF